MIEKYESTGKWTFTYIGPEGQNQSVIQNVLRVKKGNMSSFDATTSKGVGAASFSVSRGLDSYMKSSKAGNTQVSNFYDDSKDKK